MAAGSFNAGSYVSNIYSSNTSEAPIIAQKTGSNVWYLYGDSYSPVNGQFYCWQSTDITKNSWTLLDKSEYNPPMNCKHGTITAITSTELNNLISKLENPSWNRLKSYNYPDNYVRYDSNNNVILSVYPFDPYNSQQWKIVSGLADSKGVSFQSIANPNYYMRHSNFVLYSQQNDGTTMFEQDSTFYKTSGFADSSWVSFKSYNFPDYYIRHSNFQLRLDLIKSTSSNADKQDATFNICY